MDRSAQKKSFCLASFAFSERVLSFFVFYLEWLLSPWSLRPFMLTCLWDVWIIRKKLPRSSQELNRCVQASTNCLFVCFKYVFKKACFSAGQECTTTLNNFNCCFQPSLISGSLTILVGSKKWKKSVRTNAVLFHDFN